MQCSAGLPFVQDLVRISEQKGFCVIRRGASGAILQHVHVGASLDYTA
jgi:Holliday junction resolvase